MKNKIYLIGLLFLGFLFTNCEKDLDLAPKDELSQATIFSSYNNVRSYAWGFYEFFDTYTRSVRWDATRDLEADLMQNGYSSVNPDYINQSYNVPSNSGNTTYGVSYAHIRRINIMLDNISTENSNMTEEEVKHWRGVGLFFRAHEYFNLLKTYGGVTWVEHEVTDSDEILYAPRDSRDLVAGNILRDLQEAVASIKEEGDGFDTVNTDVARALLARFSLFEGSWRKYHGLGDSETYLQVAAQSSEELIQKYSLHPNYDAVFNSGNLGEVDGIILFKHYVIDELTHWVSTDTRSTNNKYDITRKGIDKFLTKNGMPVRNPNNKEFQGDKDPYAEFRDRDSRLLIMSPPPYKVNPVPGNREAYQLTGNPADEEYFPIMKEITGGFPSKELPDSNWNQIITTEVPNFNGLVPTQTANGYRFWKIWNDLNAGVSSQDLNDDPIFRLGEMMLINAEAKFELGQFNQQVADATINKLRARGGVAPLVISDITSDWDPTRDPSVDPILWEIRRERAVEMFGEGVRLDDLRRWKKMDYATEVKLGRWVKQSDYSVELPIQNSASEGYIQLVPIPAPEFPDYYYLYPLPSDELALNDNLEQNPGWGE